MSATDAALYTALFFYSLHVHNLNSWPSVTLYFCLHTSHKKLIIYQKKKFISRFEYKYLSTIQNYEYHVCKNKAGYTAHTSCGRVGRGGNVRFPTFRLVSTDGPTDGPKDGWTDKASYRVARPQLKMLVPFTEPTYTFSSKFDQL